MWKYFNIFYLIASAVHYMMPKGMKSDDIFLSIHFFTVTPILFSIL